MDEEKEISFGERLEGYLVEGCRAAAMEKAAEFLNGNDFRDYLQGVVSDEVACQLRGHHVEPSLPASGIPSGKLITERQGEALLGSGFSASRRDFSKGLVSYVQDWGCHIVRLSEVNSDDDARNVLVLYVDGKECLKGDGLSELVEKMLCFNAAEWVSLVANDIGKKILKSFIGG